MRERRRSAARWERPAGGGAQRRATAEQAQRPLSTSNTPQLALSKEVAMTDRSLVSEMSTCGAVS